MSHDTERETLADRLEAALTAIHDAVEGREGQCLGGIAGGCDACALCDLDREVGKAAAALRGSAPPTEPSERAAALNQFKIEEMFGRPLLDEHGTWK